MYKVGDELKVVKELQGHGFDIGTIVVVTRVDPEDLDTPYKCEAKDGSDYWYISEDEVIAHKVHIDFSVIQNLQDNIYEGNVKAGWWSNLTTGEAAPKGDVTLILSKLALVHSEVSEALEGVRKGLMDDKLPHRPMAEVEVADAIIRLLDLAGHEGWDVAGAIQEKLEYNKTRKDHSIEHRLSENGKKA